MNYYKLNNYAEEVYPELLSYKEKYALKLYSDYLYGIVNNDLRSGRKDHMEFIELIDSGINKFVYDEPLVVYRSLDFEEVKNKIKYIKQLEKGLFCDEGYQSTSITKENNNLFGNDIQLIINVPAFFNGACIMSFSTFKTEDEYLIGRGTKLIIDDMKFHGGKRNIRDSKVLVKAHIK